MFTNSPSFDRKWPQFKRLNHNRGDRDIGSKKLDLLQVVDGQDV